MKNKEDIVNELLKKYYYYNFIVTKPAQEIHIYPINIGLFGKTKSGKSTLINKILGEKKSFSHSIKPTPRILHFEHRGDIPLVFYDTEGFDDENSLIRANESLDEKTFDDIKSKIHVIYYLMNYSNRLEEKERKFLKAQKVNLNRTIFIGTHESDFHYQFIDKFIRNCKEEKIYSDEELEQIKNNIFCLDLIDESECNIKELKKILGKTFEICGDYYEKIKDISNKYLAELVLKDNEKNDEKNVDFKKIKESRLKKGREIINSRSWKVFGCGFIPLPLLDREIMKKQMKYMIKDLLSLYKDGLEKNEKDELYEVAITKFLGIGASGAAGTTIGVTGKIAGGLGVGILLSGITGIISGSLGKKDCIELGVKILKKLSDTFEKAFNYQEYINSNYNSFVESIEKSKRIIEYFEIGKTYDSSLYFE